VSDAVAESAGTMPVVAGAAADVVTLRRDGWQVADRLGKSLELFAARLLASPDGPTLQLTYSDGVSTASVFQQRGRLDAGGVAGWERTKVGHGNVWVQRAFPRRVVWSGRGTVYTVVADCPEGTLDALVAAFPHGEAGRGFRARLRHGVARVGSWLNPFA
jgi:hypothetical protein